MEINRRKSPGDEQARAVCLSKPSTPASNDGLDNENSDLIVYQNDVLRAGDERCAYRVLGSLGSGTFGQVLRVKREHTLMRDINNINNNNNSNGNNSDNSSSNTSNPSTTTTDSVTLGNNKNNKNNNNVEQKEEGQEEEEEETISALKIIKNHPAYFHQAHVEIGILHMLNTRCDPTGEKKIVKLLDQFVCHNHLCLVFELLDINLYEFLRKNKFRGVSLRVLRELMVQLLNALDVLREANVIHCDIKPENILLKSLSSTEVKLVDFGSACFQNRTVYQYIQSRFYRSPEVLLGTPYGMPIDMWSLGCVAAEMFLGLPILPGASEFDLLTRMCETIEPPPDSMLAKARHRHKYFVRVNSTNNPLAGQGGSSSTISDSAMMTQSESDSELLLMNNNNQNSNNNNNQNLPSNYRLLNLQQYEERSGKRAAVGKRYFHQKKLADIIYGAPYKDLGSSPGSRERENAIVEQKKARGLFLDFLFGMLMLDPTERWTPKQALLHPYITGEEFDESTPFKPPNCPETTSEETRKEHQRSAAKMAAAVSESAKREVIAAKKPKQTVQTPFPNFTQPPIAVATAAAPSATIPVTSASQQAAGVSGHLQQQQPIVGGLAAAFASASANPQSGNIAFLQAQQMQTAAAANAAAISQINSGSFGVGSFGQSPGGTQFLGNQFVGSPHAMNSAALHPLHFGQSPPTSQMQNLSMQRQKQQAVAAKAAAAVQFPAVYASPLGPGRGTLTGDNINHQIGSNRAAVMMQNSSGLMNNNNASSSSNNNNNNNNNNFGSMMNTNAAGLNNNNNNNNNMMDSFNKVSSGGSSQSSTFAGLPQSMPRQSGFGGSGSGGNAGWWGPSVVGNPSNNPPGSSISNKEKGAFSPMSRVSGFASPSGGSSLKTVREGEKYSGNVSPPPPPQQMKDMDEPFDMDDIEEQPNQDNAQTNTTSDLYKYASSAPTGTSYMQEKKRKSDR